MILFTIIRRELAIAFRKPAEILNPLWFFLMIITLFPLLMGPNPELLGKIAPGIAWVAALLSALLSFERLFKDDYLDGSLEQLMLLAVLLSLEMHVWWALVLTLLLGTPILSCLGAIGVALTVGLRKGGTLLSLLILPLFLPVLIFAAAVLEAATLNMGYSGQLAIIGAILAITLTFSPFAIAGALRISLQ